MLKRSGLILLLVVASSGEAFGDRVVSYSGRFDKQTITVPAEGFVLTDLVVSDTPDPHQFILQIDETLGTVTTTKGRFFIDIGLRGFSPTSVVPNRTISYHFESGLPFAGGSKISIDEDVHVTISGYVPSHAGVGAKSAIGGIMLLFIVAVGGFVFSRVKTSV